LLEAIPGRSKKIHLSEEMTHTEYDYFDDVGAPLSSFLKEYKIIDFDNDEQTTQHRPNFESLKKPTLDLLVRKGSFAEETHSIQHHQEKA
jgi:hypothetical protein